MNLLAAHLPGRMWWALHEDDPATFPLRFPKGWSVVTPLLYDKLDLRAGFREHHLLGLVGEALLMSCDGIVLSLPDPAETSLEQSDQLFEGVRSILARVRYLSKQATLPKDFSVLTTVETKQMPSLIFPRIKASGDAWVRKYCVSTAVTRLHLEIAGSMRSGSLPVFDTLLLDAIQSHVKRDYRTALLYSAMAMEAVAGTKLEEAYDRALRGGDAANALRIVSIRQSGGKSAVKDPVYELLRNRTEFSQLLHETPLYLLGRSLLIENEPLYQRARKLYRTRNKLVHRGETPERDAKSYYGMNNADVLTAVKCAIDVCDWFGAGAHYSAWTDEMERFQPVE